MNPSLLRTRLRALVGALSLSIASFSNNSPAQAQAPAFDVKGHYTKQEVFIPMRDGVKLFTIVYAPRAQGEKYPILLTRTAYGIAPYGPDNYRATRELPFQRGQAIQHRQPNLLCS